MDTQPLVESDPSKTDNLAEPRLVDMAIIPRYNVFIRNYNLPTCIVNNTQLQSMPVSFLHDTTFLVLNNWKGKVHFSHKDRLYYSFCYLHLYWTVLFSFSHSTVYTSTANV